MENKSVILLLFALLVVFVLAFTLCLDAVANNQVLYGAYAFAGFLIVVLLSLFESVMLKKDGGVLTYWFRIFTIISLIVLVWYSTRVGTLFGWW